MGTKCLLDMKIYLINVLQLVLFRSLDPSLISFIWAPTNGFSRIIWNLVSYCCYIRGEVTFKKKIIGLSVFWSPYLRFSNDRYIRSNGNIFWIYFRYFCRHSDANMDANPYWDVRVRRMEVVIRRGRITWVNCKDELWTPRHTVC